MGSLCPITVLLSEDQWYKRKRGVDRFAIVFADVHDVTLDRKHEESCRTVQSSLSTAKPFTSINRLNMVGSTWNP